MPRCPGINHQRAVRAFAKVGYRVIRQSGHIAMSDGEILLIIPRHNPVDAVTMGGLIAKAGLTIEQFRELL